MAKYDEELTEKEIVAKGKVAPRLTPQDIDDQIVAKYWFRVSDMVSKAAFAHSSLERLTICVLVLKNGFMVTGESACASPENYDAEIGRRLAFDQARNKIWAFESYTLRNVLSNRHEA